jgi:hypothetical protein
MAVRPAALMEIKGALKRGVMEVELREWTALVLQLLLDEGG